MTNNERAPRRESQSADLRPADIDGLVARRLAVELIEAVRLRGQALDEAMDGIGLRPEFADLEPRDRGFARLIAATVLRRYGSLEHVLGQFLERPLPVAANRPRSILLVAAAQVLLIGTPAHAAISLAVSQCKADRAAARFDKLANAVLRRVATEGPAVLAQVSGPEIDLPQWLWQRWVAAYGAETAREIAAASLVEAPLDISLKDVATSDEWRDRLAARPLDTGSLRLAEAGRVEEVPGFREGAWWVQDAAAALPARLLCVQPGETVADLCAAPGGKTLALASAGATVTAVDQSATRLARLAANVARLGLGDRVTTVTSALARWRPDAAFDAVLLDAPCTATGTIRRHPDILHLKRSRDAARLASVQLELLKSASRHVRPGGRLVYCVCSLEPEEGSGVVEAFLAENQAIRRRPVTADEIAGHADWLTPIGDLRTLPSHAPAEGATGMDGFYAARFEREDA